MDDTLDPRPTPPRTPRLDDSRPADSRPGAPKRRRRRKRVTKATAPPPPGTLAPGLLHAIREALETLRWSARAIARSRGLDARIESLDVTLPISGKAPPETLAEGFVRGLLEQLERIEGERDAVVPRRAWCFRCDSFLCAHAQPPEPRSVLSGYEPTGRPRWSDLLALLFDRRDPRAEPLAEGARGVVALALEGSELLADRLEAFGGATPAVEVVAQVIAGPFPVPSAAGPDEEAALTVQFLAVRDGAHTKLVLHPIGDARLLDAGASPVALHLAPILATARSALSGRARGAATTEALRRAASPAAHDLVRDLQHHFQIRGRRTAHAVERAEIGVRPTAQAFPDARAASDDAIRFDRETHTIVLLGRNGRVHFFNGEGRHVSSVRYPGEAIRARIDVGRWREATAAEVARFRARVPANGAQRPGPSRNGDAR